MGVRVIPTEAYPETTQQCDLDGRTYSFRFKWNQRAACWHLDLATSDGTPIATGVKLVTAFPLLRRVVVDGRPPGELFLLDMQDREGRPTLEEFGSRYVLHYVEQSGIEG